jgi:hypothetical protein
MQHGTVPTRIYKTRRSACRHFAVVRFSLGSGTLWTLLNWSFRMPRLSQSRGFLITRVPFRLAESDGTKVLETPMWTVALIIVVVWFLLALLFYCSKQ